LPNLKGPFLIIAVICFAFVLGYKQDALLREIRSKWAIWNPAFQLHSSDAKQLQDTKPLVSGIKQQSSSALSQAPIASKTPESRSRNIQQIESLESVTPGSVQPRQEQQRNLYFEKLSEQLRELKGEAPSTNPAQKTAPQPSSASTIHTTDGSTDTDKDADEEQLQEPEDSASDDQVSEEENSPGEPDE
jgi:hypothetical protein